MNTALRLILLFGIVAINAFFAAAEVALVSVRRSRLRELASQGNVAARAAMDLLSNPERLLSVTQFGVTLASLGLGWAGEDTVYRMILGALQPVLTPERETVLHAISFTIAFLIISFIHVVIGEVVPKNIAIDKADRLALLVAPVLLVFDRISAPFVSVVEKTAAALSRLLGVRGHGAGGHSAEEIKFVVETSTREGHLEDFARRAISRLLELQDVSTREIMTPRRAIVSVPVTASLDDLLRLTREHKHSRLPVYDGAPENVIGILHYKDLVRAWQERKFAAERGHPPVPFQLRRYLRKPLVVPETKPLTQLVDEFRDHHTHLAMVVDEFGTITGLVTLQDVMEQVFGEMADEHGIRRVRPAAGASVLELDGTISIRDLSSQYGIDLPGEAGFETLAGFILYRLGYIPAPGDSVTYGGRTFTVQSMDRNRIERVKVVAAPSVSPGASGKIGDRSPQ
jgi:putative hemolysin